MILSVFTSNCECLTTCEFNDRHIWSNKKGFLEHYSCTRKCLQKKVHRISYCNWTYSSYRKRLYEIVFVLFIVSMLPTNLWISLLYVCTKKVFLMFYSITELKSTYSSAHLFPHKIIWEQLLFSFKSYVNDHTNIQFYREYYS